MVEFVKAASRHSAGHYQFSPEEISYVAAVPQDEALRMLREVGFHMPEPGTACNQDSTFKAFKEKLRTFEGTSVEASAEVRRGHQDAVKLREALATTARISAEYGIDNKGDI